MSLIYERTEDYVLTLSDRGFRLATEDAGMQKLADEQRLACIEPLYVKVRIAAIAGAVVTIALPVIFHGV